MSRALFPELDLELPDDRPGPGKRASYFAAVALEQSIDKELDYEVPANLWDEVKIGQRVRVPLGRGNKLAFGYVVGLHREQRYPKTKPIRAIADPRPLVDGPLLELARWIGRYYVCPIGTVIDSILPSAVKKRVGIGYVTMCALAMSRDAVQDLLETTKAPKRRALLGRLLQVEEGGEIELVKLASEAGVKPPTVRKLSKLGVITLRNVADLPALSVPKHWSGTKQQPLTLSAEQRVVMDNLAPRLADGFSVNLLHGVTGSGKTEVYLQAIAKVVEGGRQAIVLVPEIALTPQTVRRFTGRFEKVAVLHSGLTAGARHRFWQQIAASQADVVVGARSAIFAPVPKLGIVVVDEEHENSYKQDQAPRYHARDVAIKRAQMAGCAVVLGSATPSLESWARASREVGKSGSREAVGTEPSPQLPNFPTSHLLSLPSRIAERPMPAIEIIDLRNVQRQTRRLELLSPRVEHLLRVTKDAGEQSILLLNRRGYANFVFCPSCLEPVNCRFCDATMTYHRNVGVGPRSGTHDVGKHTGQLHCHYCLAVQPRPDECQACGHHRLNLFGMGTQHVKEELQRKLPDLRF
ncbi:MAG: primosomal protein N', partial [Planctomycetota bacterium]